LEQIEEESRQINISVSTRLYGVLGHPVGHSLSPPMQNAALAEMGLDAVYLAFDVPPERLELALRGLAALGAAGVNLTIPLKERAVPLLDWVSPEAIRIGAVNTIKIEGERTQGYNTDAPGFLASLRSCSGDPTGKRCVVLGAGGSARAVSVALAGAGARMTLVNRTVERAMELARILREDGRDPVAQVLRWDSPGVEAALSEAELLVNTTPIGMAPHADDPLPVPASALHPHLFVYDLIYNPAETRLLAEARRCGARGANGIGMLAHQGALALEIWTGRPAPAATMERVLREVLSELA
jgi:shikimate dehydrogenase